MLNSLSSSNANAGYFQTSFRAPAVGASPGLPAAVRPELPVQGDKVDFSGVLQDASPTMAKLPAEPAAKETMAAPSSGLLSQAVKQEQGVSVGASGHTLAMGLDDSPPMSNQEMMALMMAMQAQNAGVTPSEQTMGALSPQHRQEVQVSSMLAATERILKLNEQMKSPAFFRV